MIERKNLSGIDLIRQMDMKQLAFTWSTMAVIKRVQVVVFLGTVLLPLCVQAQQRIELAIRRQNESEQQFRAREARLQRQFQIRMEAARKAGGKPNAALSAKYGYIVDSSGKAILGKNGKRIPVRSDSSAAPWKEKEAKK